MRSASALVDLPVAVRCRRLDDFGLEPVGVIKIDAEGHELTVLQGARALIERDRPSFLIEAEERHKKEEPTPRPIPRDLIAVARSGQFLSLLVLSSYAHGRITALALTTQSAGLREGQGLTVSVPPALVVVLPSKFAAGAAGA